MRRAAREGDAWYAHPSLAADDLAEAIVRYREYCAEYGTTARVALRRDILIGRNDSETMARGREMITAGHRGLDESHLVFGGVGRVAE